jgi:K+-sensing histidine kinase KdpD
MRRSYLRNLAYQSEQNKAQQLEMSLAFEQERRLESASFLSMLLHELKTPLASIRLAAIAVLREIAGSHPNANERMRTIETSINDINHVLERTLEADRLEQGGTHVQIARTHVAALITERIALMEQADRVSLHLDATLEVQVDGYLLGLMVSNLLNNAQAYSAPDSEIEVVARQGPASGLAPTGTSLYIAVKNLPGRSGYPDPEKLFQKYYRSPRAQFHTGTGLGLYWVRGVLSLMGGQCQYSLETQKIVFELEVPC